MTLNFILGTAAELIKMHPVIRTAEERGHTVRLVATGQSRENLILQLEDFGYDPGRVSWLVASDGDLAKAASALKWFARGLLSWRRARRLLPDGLVVVHGDTLSTLLGAIHGRRLGLTVAHVEAGLRSSSLLNPFPEEINRRLVSRLARVHMAPDETAAGNLRGSGVGGRVVCTHGNTLMDAVRLSGETDTGAAGTAGPAREFVLVNVHRFENLNSPERWRMIVDSVLMAARDRAVVFVAHPQTQHKLAQDAPVRKRFAEAGIEVRERMAFSRFIALLKRCDYLISDGGSNQEECSYLGKPCLLLRESTERIEGLGGCCVLSRFDSRVIEEFMRGPEKFRRPQACTGVSPSAVILDHLQGGL